ncbi:hypothetical protein [Geodermatophilus marinus]|uniref:hypothetical protein n=1 Tax=Geodermatophilus sp. LHW52908 TaxID=2303986 RepID=UPI000E3C6558|nr:hypothetical protein [Geodermatophilus sp. LHW52908]RFU22033.1 hypothetical protein D0Z06_07880 [Geodermatophilus sp. LHW52908]
MRAAVEAHLGSRRVARVVYGAIIGLALVVAGETHPPGAGAMAAWLVASGVAVGLAEIYSEVVGVETSQRHRVTRAQVRHMTGDAGAVAFGAGFPAVFFVLAALGLLELGTAFDLATWTGLGLIGFYGYWAARFAGAPVGRALVQATLVALVGALVIGVKALVH